MLFCRQTQSFTGHTIDALLNVEGATFYIRLKAENYVECDGQRTKIEAVPQKDALITSSRMKIVRIYYHRFEIEETFKDTKHLFEYRGYSSTDPPASRWCCG